MKTIANLGLAFLLALATAACTTVADDGGQNGPDGGNAIDGNGDLTVNPPPESTTWSCRSGVNAAGEDYVEFRPGYLNNGAEANAYIVGQAPSEGIVGYFTGSYVTRGKDAGSTWYRLYLTGPDGQEAVLTYARCVDTVGNNSACWAQYGLPLPATNAGPFRTCNGTSCACKFKRNHGHPATALGGN